MEDKNKQLEPKQVQPSIGCGSLLASARKQQKKSVEEIADELNLSISQIKTIELDQSEGLPEPTYVRGYIRSYARVLGLNVDDVLDHYLNPNWQKGARLDDMPRGIGTANESESRGISTSTKVVVFIMVAAVAGFLWFTGKLDGILGKAPATQVAVVASNNADTTTSTSTVQSPVIRDSVANSPASTPRDSIVASANTSETEQTISTGEELPVDQPGAAGNKLSLSFTDASWIDIRDADGNRLAYKSYAKDEDLTVSAPSSMSVFIGNASAVSATLNGESYDISQHQNGAFARFTVGE